MQNIRFVPSTSRMPQQNAQQNSNQVKTLLQNGAMMKLFATPCCLIANTQTLHIFTKIVCACKSEKLNHQCEQTLTGFILWYRVVLLLKHCPPSFNCYSVFVTASSAGICDFVYFFLLLQFQHFLFVTLFINVYIVIIIIL